MHARSMWNEARLPRRIDGVAPKRHELHGKATAQTDPPPCTCPDSATSAGFDAQRVRLRDGREVALRPANRADGSSVQQFVRGLSASARRSRFFAPVRELSPDQLERVIRSCLPDALAIVAETTDERSARIVALAQYAACEPPEAEFAVVVGDAWQRQGLATQMLATLADHALEGGLTALTGLVLDDNWPMLSLLARHGCELTQDAYAHTIRAALPVHTLRPSA